MKQLKRKSYFFLCVFSCLLLAFIAYLNGKLDENTKYAVLQRSFDQDGNYENEGFIKFTTKKVIKDKFPTALMALSIVVGLLAALILVGGIKMWRRHHNGAFNLYILVLSNPLSFPILQQGEESRTKKIKTSKRGKVVETQKSKSAFRRQVTLQAKAYYPGFSDMKQQGTVVFLVPWMDASLSQNYPQHYKTSPAPIYTSG